MQLDPGETKRQRILKVEAACPTGWDSVVPGCYKFASTQDTMSYSDASSSCAAISGKLVVFNSEEEMYEVGYTYASPYISAASAGWIWIGCTDQAVEGTFECEDGTQVESVDPIPDTTPSPPPQQAKYRNRSGFYSMAKDNNGSPMIDYCLSDHVMKTIYMKDKLHCAAECEKEPGCMSFNYRDGKCELNAETKDGASSTSFSQRDGCLYYEPL
eukprot:XP_011666551.1 PREDICTED: uncharacterized protein LOC105439357 isoform X2 [Strongylocentrotus purpuratus]